VNLTLGIGIFNKICLLITPPFEDVYALVWRVGTCMSMGCRVRSFRSMLKMSLPQRGFNGNEVFEASCVFVNSNKSKSRAKNHGSPFFAPFLFCK